MKLCTQNFRNVRSVKDAEITMLKDILEVYLLTVDRKNSIFQSENETSWECGRTASEW